MTVTKLALIAITFYGLLIAAVVVDTIRVNAVQAEISQGDSQ